MGRYANPVYLLSYLYRVRTAKVSIHEICKAAAVGLCVAGGTLWTKVWWQNRSLFLDEANLARNLAEKDLSDLFSQLDYQQYAPPLFLFLEKLSFDCLGGSEQALRLVPLLAGFTALFFLYKTSRRLLPIPCLALFPLWLMVFSPDFLRYATEIKQYSVDVAVTLGLLYFAWRHPPGKNHGNALSWGIGGAMVLWLSMPSAFTLAGVGAYAWQRMESAPKLLLPVAGSWLTSFGLYYVFLLRPDLGQDQLFDYHQRYFLPLLPESNADWQQLLAIFRSIGRTAFGYTTAALTAGALFTTLGTLHLWRKERSLLLLLSIPILACCGASALHLYSLMPRLTLFFIPLLWLIAAHGIVFLWATGKWWRRGPAIAGLVLILSLPDGWRYFRKPYTIEEIKPVLSYLHDHFQSGDQVLVHAEAVPAFRYYTEHHPQHAAFAVPPSAVHFAAWDSSPEALFGQAVPKARCRWLVFSHLISEESRRLKKEWLTEAQAREWKESKHFNSAGAACYCFTNGS